MSSLYHIIKKNMVMQKKKKTIHKIPCKPTRTELDTDLLLAAELAAGWPAALAFELADTVASLTGNRGTAGPAFSFVFSLGILAWLRSSSQDPMVAARLASLPLLPRGVSEDTGGTAAGGTSARLFNRDMGVLSWTASELPENWKWQWTFTKLSKHQVTLVL